MVVIRGGNRAGRAGLGRANTGPGQNRAGLKLARFFRAKILTAQPALKTGPIGPNSHSKAKKNSGGPGQIWPDFFRAKNLMAQPDPNFGRTGLAHRAGPILPPLVVICPWPSRHNSFEIYHMEKFKDIPLIGEFRNTYTLFWPPEIR